MTNKEEIKCSFCGDDKYTRGVDEGDIHCCEKCFRKEENPLSKALNNKETIRKAAEQGAEDQNKMMEKSKEDWTKEFRHFLNSGCNDDFYVAYVKELLQEAKQEEQKKIYDDLLEIANQGEIEDLRREVEKYFN